MSEAYFDEYEHYNFDHDKHIFSGRSGKQRSKKEASEHTNHFDPNGHSRKLVTKFMNTNNNRKTCAAKNWVLVQSELAIVQQEQQQQQQKQKQKYKSVSEEQKVKKFIKIGNHSIHNKYFGR